MPPSLRPWPGNVGDYASAQLEDLGLPLAAAADGSVRGALVAIGLVAALLAAAFWRLRTEPARQGLVALFAGYAAAGALMLIVSRSRYEWGNLIDTRNTLQYTWALALVLVLAAGVLLPARTRRYAAVAGAVVVALQLVIAVREAVDARRAGTEPWLVLTEDRAVMAAARALPAQTLIASNTAVLFRLGALRAVRQLDVGGIDKDFRGSLEILKRAAGTRPAAFLLVCNEWTGGFSACGARGAGEPGAPACVRVRGIAPLVAICAGPRTGSVGGGPQR
jgi:hypothetical protein